MVEKNIQRRTMKIAVSGTHGIGKSTYISDFINNWGMYKKEDSKDYVNLVKEKGLELNEKSTQESQKIIRDYLIDQIINTKEDNVIFNRSVLDNLIYTMWLYAKNIVPETFVDECIKITKETLCLYDIIFFVPITKISPIPFKPRQNQSNDQIYRKEIDNIFKAIIHQYNIGNKIFFPFDNKLGCPAIIEIYGNREERIELTKLYVQADGRSFDEKDTLLLPTDPQLPDFG